jgi:hypothetical protein
MHENKGSSGPSIAGLITIVLIGALIFLMVRSMWNASSGVGSGSMHVSFDDIGKTDFVQYEYKTEGSVINYYVKGTKTIIFAISNDNVTVTDSFLTYESVRGYTGPVTFESIDWNTPYITIYNGKAYRAGTARFAVANSTSVNDAYALAKECKGTILKQTTDANTGDVVYYIERSRMKDDQDGTSMDEWMKKISGYSFVKAVDMSPEIAVYAFAIRN